MADQGTKKSISRHAFINKLRRLADALDAGDPFLVQVKGEKVYVPKKGKFFLEFEDGDPREFSLKVTWK